MTTATRDRRTGDAPYTTGGSGEGGDQWDDWSEQSNGGRHGGNDGERLARTLGLFSIGLGLSQVLAPGGVARTIGLVDTDDNRKTMRAFGVREMATGVGLLTQRQPATFAWGRVAGDVMDLTALGRALRSNRNDTRRLAAATAAVVGVTILDILASQKLSAASNGGGRQQAKSGGIRVEKAITINRSPEEVYRFWRDFENLPRFMEHLDTVESLGDRRSRWKAKAPLGTKVEWEAEIVEDRPNELIAWRSVEQADVPNMGQVLFTPAPGDRGTEVRVRLTYDPPGGTLGAVFAKLFGEEPSQQVDGDLRRFKQVMEIGEVVHSDASIHRGMHPAQPPAEVPPSVLNQQGVTS